MSRGPGAIERAIKAQFSANPSRTYTVDELAVTAYPGLNQAEKKHRVAVIRAADKVTARCWWTTRRASRPGHPTVYMNLLDVRSYALGHMRTDHIDGAKPIAELERQLDDPQSHGSRWEWVQPGGGWWRHVEINKAQRDGRLDDVSEMQSSLRAYAARQYAKGRS